MWSFLGFGGNSSGDNSNTNADLNKDRRDHTQSNPSSYRGGMGDDSDNEDTGVTVEYVD